MPAPTSPITPTSRTTSSHVASRDATGRSSDVSWCSLRDVVKPDRAGRERVGELALHRREVVVGGLLVEGALAHRRRAQRRVADVGGVVDPLREPVDRVEVLGERLPAPLDAGGERARVDVLGPLEVAHDERAGVGRAPARG